MDQESRQMEVARILYQTHLKAHRVLKQCQQSLETEKKVLLHLTTPEYLTSSMF
jgi:hypothetical protein